jgi:hypothetical protein
MVSRLFALTTLGLLLAPAGHAEDMTARAEELYRANPAEHFLSADVQVPALARALELRQRQASGPGEAWPADLSRGAMRDLQLIWARWYGLERDGWLGSTLSVERFCLDLTLPRGTHPEDVAAVLRGLGGCDAYVAGAQRLFAFQSGVVADPETHQALLGAAGATAAGSFVWCSELRASFVQPAGDPAPSLCWLSGQVSPTGFRVQQAGLSGTRLRAADLPKALSLYYQDLQANRAHRDNRTRLITLDLPTAEAAAALADRLQAAIGGTAPTWHRGRRLRTYDWDCDVALVTSYDRFAASAPLFPPRPGSREHAARRRSAQHLPLSFWATGRARRRAIRWAIFIAALPVVAGSVVLVWRRRRGARRGR